MLKVLFIFVLVCFMIANTIKITLDVLAVRKAKKTYAHLLNNDRKDK